MVTPVLHRELASRHQPHTRRQDCDLLAGAWIMGSKSGWRWYAIESPEGSAMRLFPPTTWTSGSSVVVCSSIMLLTACAPAPTTPDVTMVPWQLQDRALRPCQRSSLHHCQPILQPRRLCLLKSRQPHAPGRQSQPLYTATPILIPTPSSVPKLLGTGRVGWVCGWRRPAADSSAGSASSLIGHGRNVSDVHLEPAE